MNNRKILVGVIATVILFFSTTVRFANAQFGVGYYGGLIVAILPPGRWPSALPVVWTGIVSSACTAEMENAFGNEQLLLVPPHLQWLPDYVPVVISTALPPGIAELVPDGGPPELIEYLNQPARSMEIEITIERAPKTIELPQTTATADLDALKQRNRNLSDQIVGLEKQLSATIAEVRELKSTAAYKMVNPNSGQSPSSFSRTSSLFMVDWKSRTGLDSATSFILPSGTKQPPVVATIKASESHSFLENVIRQLVPCPECTMDESGRCLQKALKQPGIESIGVFMDCMLSSPQCKSCVPAYLVAAVITWRVGPLAGLLGNFYKK